MNFSSLKLPFKSLVVKPSGWLVFVFYLQNMGDNSLCFKLNNWFGKVEVNKNQISMEKGL